MELTTEAAESTERVKLSGSMSDPGTALIPILTATKTRRRSETDQRFPAPIRFVCFVLSWLQCRFWGGQEPA